MFSFRPDPKYIKGRICFVLMTFCDFAASFMLKSIAPKNNLTALLCLWLQSRGLINQTLYKIKHLLQRAPFVKNMQVIPAKVCRVLTPFQLHVFPSAYSLQSMSRVFFNAGSHFEVFRQTEWNVLRPKRQQLDRNSKHISVACVRSLRSQVS